MKRLFLILLMNVSVMLLLPGSALAEQGKTKTIPLKKEKWEETELPPDSWSQRMPATPVMCVISENGITIEGSDSPEFTLYEVYDEAGACQASYSSERDFIAFIFQTESVVEIRFYTDRFVYSGWW